MIVDAWYGSQFLSLKGQCKICGNLEPSKNVAPSQLGKVGLHLQVLVCPRGRWCIFTFPANGKRCPSHQMFNTKNPFQVTQSNHSRRHAASWNAPLKARPTRLSFIYTGQTSVQATKLEG